MSSIHDVRLIELEIHSYCNRTCLWCPNSYIDRHSSKINMDERLFKSIIDELSDLSFNKVISFSRYNEPFSDKELLMKRIAYIREMLHDVILVTNTNGDYDTSGVDIDQITEMDYDMNKKHYTSADGKYRVTGLTEINNRGGALQMKQVKRDFPCFEPKYFIGIDYTGMVTPCCNIRSDVPIHKPYVLGSLKFETLQEIFESKKAEKFRDDVAHMRFPNICEGCGKKPGRYTRDNGGINGVI